MLNPDYWHDLFGIANVCSGCYNIHMQNERRRTTAYPERIDAVKRHIRDHLDEPLDRTALADVAGFSVPHFQRIFTAQVGENTAGYVRRIRLDRAGRKLIMGAVDITEIALAAGYHTHAAFGKAFKQQYGLSPSQLRRLNTLAALKILSKGRSG
jgi:AraC family transcriptional regulator